MKYLTNWNAKTRVDDLLTTDRYPTAPSEAFVRYFPQARFWAAKLICCRLVFLQQSAR